MWNNHNTDVKITIWFHYFSSYFYGSPHSNSKLMPLALVPQSLGFSSVLYMQFCLQ